jgi:hypothetical protein
MNEGTYLGKSIIRLLGISAERPTNGLLRREKKKLITLEVTCQVIWPINKPLINGTGQRNQIQCMYLYVLNFDLYIKPKRMMIAWNIYSCMTKIENGRRALQFKTCGRP